MFFNHRTAYAVLALLAGFGLGSPTGFATVSAPYRLQFEIKLSRVLKAQKDALTHEDWVRSGDLPDSIAELARSLSRVPGERAEVSAALCKSLLALSQPNLAVFESMLKEQPEQISDSCQRRLLVRIRHHWFRQRDSLAGYAQVNPMHKMPRLDPLEVKIASKTGPVFFKGSLADGEFALTFDDGPDADRTPRLLTALRSSGTRATFFTVGVSARKNPQIIRQLETEGHSVGSHTWSHPLLTELEVPDAHAEIAGGAEVISELLGFRAAPFFRFPYGARTNEMQEYVRSRKLATFFWNLDSLDWKLYQAIDLYQHLISEIDYRKGGIILMHANLEQTVIVLPYLLVKFEELGIRPAVFVAD